MDVFNNMGRKYILFSSANTCKKNKINKKFVSTGQYNTSQYSHPWSHFLLIIFTAN